MPSLVQIGLMVWPCIEYNKPQTHTHTVNFIDIDNKERKEINKTRLERRKYLDSRRHLFITDSYDELAIN